MSDKEQIKRDALILANSRRVHRAPKSRSNAGLYMDIFGTGFTTARHRCVQLGLDPDGNETRYNCMIDFIDAEPQS